MMIKLEDAIELLQSNIEPQTRTRELDLLDSVNHILAADIFAPISVPSFPKSAMDGYAIRSVDSKGAKKESPVVFQVVGEILAGDYKEYNAAPFLAVRVMTGALIPEGYDCVIKQEDTDYGETKVSVFKEMEPIENYCPIGEDMKEGQLVVKAHTRIDSVVIGILASLGIQSVVVLEPMKVGIISTGSELIMAGEGLSPAKIYNSCCYTLASSIKQAGLNVTVMMNCADEMELMTTCIKEQIEKVDLLITTGGVSVGKKDLIPDLMKGLGAKPLFQRVNMKPGTPMLANQYRGKLVLSFSGNPFAALTNFELFFWPITAAYMSHDGFAPKSKEAVLLEGSLKENKLRRFVRAHEENGVVTLPAAVHASSVLSNLMGCNCFIDQPEDIKLKKGDKVRVIPIMSK